MAGTTKSLRVQTALGVLQAWNESSVEKFMSFRSDDCVHIIQPKFMNRNPMNNAEYAAFMSTFIVPNFRNFKVEIDDIFEDEKANKLAVWIHGSSVTDIGLYENQYVIMLYFDDTSTKVVKYVEFPDSGYTEAFMAKLKVHLAREAAAAESEI